jgi:hypothetical protein
MFPCNKNIFFEFAQFSLLLLLLLFMIVMKIPPPYSYASDDDSHHAYQKEFHIQHISKFVCKICLFENKCW